MTTSHQRQWITDIVETVPSLIFLALWRGGLVDLETAGWIGSALAATLLVGFRCYRKPFNPILLGINLHLLAITPLITTLFRLDAPDLARAMIETAESGVLVVVFAVGCGLAAAAHRGFIGSDELPPATRRRYSLALLALAGAAIPWSFSHSGDTLLSIGLPLMTLFGLRRLLIARGLDQSKDTDDVAPGLAIAPSHPGDAT